MQKKLIIVIAAIIILALVYTYIKFGMSFFSKNVKDVVLVRGVPATYMGEHGGGVLISDTKAGKVYKLTGNRLEMGEWFKEVEELDTKDGSMPIIYVEGIVRGKESDVVTTNGSYPIPSGPDVWGQNAEVWKNRIVNMDILEVTYFSDENKEIK